MTNEFLNPVDVAQQWVADILAADDWFATHNVTIVKQNSLGLRYLMEKSIGQLRGVCLVIGTDDVSNDYPALECNVTIQCFENVIQNRVRENSATAMDVACRAICAVDGEWWHFENLRHESPEDGILIATANFRGLVKRVEQTNEEN